MSSADVDAGVGVETYAGVRRGSAQPLGVPVIFLRDQLALTVPGGAASGYEHRVNLLAHEYAQASGYSFDWGQLIEQRLGDITVWRVVPVELWLDAERRALAGGGIVGLIGALHTLVRQHIPVHPHPLVLRSGCSDSGQRMPHALLSLLCARPQCLDEVRAWLASEFLSQTLPCLLNACRIWLEDMDSADAIGVRAQLRHGTCDKRAGVLVGPTSGAGVQRAKRSA